MDLPIRCFKGSQPDEVTLPDIRMFTLIVHVVPYVLLYDATCTIQGYCILSHLPRQLNRSGEGEGKAWVWRKGSGLM